MVLRDLNLQPDAVILSHIEFESVAKGHILLVSHLKDLLKLLPKKLFVIYEYILWRFLHEIENAHNEH